MAKLVGNLMIFVKKSSLIYMYHQNELIFPLFSMERI